MERDRNISILPIRMALMENGSSSYINTIIQARMEEIFELVKEDVEEFLLNKPLGAGAFNRGRCFS